MEPTKEEKEHYKILQKAKESALNFHKEVRKSIATAIVAAFGFIIALSWRDVIMETTGKIAQLTPFQGKVAEAFIITAISVLGIFLVSKFVSQTESLKIT